MYIHQSVRMRKTLGAGTHRMHVHVAHFTCNFKYIHVHPPMIICIAIVQKIQASVVHTYNNPLKFYNQK